MYFRHRHWSKAVEILADLWHPRARVAVKACHASSKTFLAADAVCLALLDGADVLTTAPTWIQVRNLLWGEIAKTTQETPNLNWGRVNTTDIRMPGGNFALGLSTRLGVRFQGFHSRPDSYLLVIFDEAPGVIPSISESVEGISAGGDVRWLQIGNPVLSSGPFFDIFRDRAQEWKRHTISALDTPNMVGLTLSDLLAMPDHELDENPWPFLVTRRWVKERLIRWGEDSAPFQSRVLGEFPAVDPYALIPLAWAERAAVDDDAPDTVPVWAGVDVAGPGEDETVICVRAGSRVVEVLASSNADPRGWVVAQLARYRGRLQRVNVDSVGIGYYFAQHLRDLQFPVTEVNVGSSPSTRLSARQRIAGVGETDRYANLRAELYWDLRGRFQRGEITGLADDETQAQLATIRYLHTPKGEIAIERKEDALKRGVSSPDRAEAVMLAFAEHDRNVDLAALYAQPLGVRVG